MALFGKKVRLLNIILPLLLALLFFSFTGTGFRRAPWYEEILWRIISPPQEFFSGIGRSVAGTWHRYVALVDVQAQNDALRRRLSDVEGKQIQAQEMEEENKRLHALLAFRNTFAQRTLIARVIANDPRAEFKSITIDRGARDGIVPMMPVIGPRGLVGKVGKVAAHEARIILVTDPNSAVDVMVQRSRARGMVVGAAWHTELKAGYYLTRLEYLRGVSDVRDDDVIVTSGLDAVFPPGIPVGTVSNLRLSRYGIFREANVVPFEEMAELQEVLILLSKVETMEEEEQ